MQIHELNQPRKSNITEVDLFGPGSVFNVAKQVVKNPKALGSSSALGAAQQAAVQSSAQGSAEKLAAQGYRVGASAVAKVNLAQQLQAVQQNSAVQQQVKNLTGQWLSQAAQAVDNVKARNISEASVVISNPEGTKDPAERKLLDLFYQQQAAKGQVSGTTPDAAQQPVVPDNADRTAVNKKIQDIASVFATWADSKLSIPNQGIDMNSIRGDSQYKQALNDQLTRVAIESLANPTSAAATKAVNDYFTLAIAAIQTEVNNRRASQGGQAQATQAAATSPQEQDTQVLTMLQQQGIPVTRANLEKLGQLMANSSGSNTIRNTGNPILNAIARIAGMRIST